MSKYSLDYNYTCPDIANKLEERIMFTEDELEYISQVYTECKEDFCGLRKGVAQTKYRITVPNTVVWCHKAEDFINTPKHLVGTWKEKWAGDNTQISVEERLGVRDPYGFKTEWKKCA